MKDGSVSKDLGDGILQVDTGYHRPGLAACYCVIEKGRAAIFDTGVSERFFQEVKS